MFDAGTINVKLFLYVKKESVHDILQSRAHHFVVVDKTSVKFLIIWNSLFGIFFACFYIYV